MFVHYIRMTVDVCVCVCHCVCELCRPTGSHGLNYRQALWLIEVGLTEVFWF